MFIFIINEYVELAMINEFLIFDNKFDDLIHVDLIHVSKIIVNESVIDKRFKKNDNLIFVIEYVNDRKIVA